MILTCSSCATRFLVDAAAIGPAGRHVRCARCQHGWFQEPAADLPRSVPPAAAAENNSAQNAEPRPASAAAPAGRPAPLRRGANLPALPRKQNQMAGILSWAALVLFIAGLLGGGYMFRDQIVIAWPQAANLYAALGIETQISSLRLAEVSFSRDMQNGRSELTVRGVIINDGASEMQAPLMLIKLRNAAGRDIFQWTYQLPQPILAPGAKAPFETSLSDPPADARNLEVTFASGG